MQEIFTKWKNTSSTFAKLQAAYATIAVALLLLGGLMSLVDYATGYRVATFSLYIAGVFVINFVADSVITSLVGGNKSTRSTKK